MSATGKPTIFVVDNEPVIATTLAVILNASGFEATSFTNPVSALRSAENACPELLIADVLMPELNGVDLALNFKTICPDCGVLLLSGQGSTSAILERALDKGYSFKILMKPAHPEEILATIKSLRSKSPSVNAV